jgi:hypothetical protein
VHNLVSRNHAGGNGLMTDKGSHNKWFDCVAEYCDSQMDGHQSHDIRNTIDV